jgi:diguanylate cyclase (GGDEF)-like protein
MGEGVSKREVRRPLWHKNARQGRGVANHTNRMNTSELLIAMRRTVEQIAAFNELAKALTSTLEVREVLELVMQKVSELLKPANWSLILQDPLTGELYFELVVGSGAEKLKQIRFPSGEGIAGHVFATGEALRVDDVSRDARFSRRFDQVSDFSTRSALAVPLRVRGKALGVIELVNGPDSSAFTAEDQLALSGVADFAAIAIDNAQNFQRVQELTLTDEHTGLFNARHLRASLEREVVRASRFNHPLSLVFLDLDHFKRVNDTHGHLVGSGLLREVGEILRGNIRQVDVAFRYGGDEFALLLIETDRAGARALAERLRETFAQRAFMKAQGLQVSLTASFGVATCPEDADDALSVLEAADKAMYRVKASGRNGVMGAWEPALSAVKAYPAEPPT